MRNLPRIVNKVHREPWMIRPDTLHTFAGMLEQRLSVRADVTDMGDDDECDDDEMVKEIGSSVVIKVFGVIGKHLSGLEMQCGGCSVDAVCDALEDADEDQNCGRIYLWFNSPGGTVAGIQEAGALIADIATRKEVVALIDNECCSAAYWMASQCTTIVCTPSATIGSIGVYCLLLDQSKQLEEAGIKVNAISAGEYKLAGASFRPLSDIERKMFQDSVDKTYSIFKAAVSDGRAGAVADETMQGWCYDGEEAVQKGLADEVVMSIGCYVMDQVDERNLGNELV